jgi:serine protease AprX
MKLSRNGDMKNNDISRHWGYLKKNIRAFKSIIPLSVVFLLMTAILPGYADNRIDNAGVSTYIVVFKDTPGAVRAASYDSLDQMVTSYGGSVKYRYDIIDGMAITMPDDEASRLSSLSNVAYVVPDGVVYAQLDRAIPQIGADQVWASGYSGKGVRVAVLDSGVDTSHPDIGNGSKVVAWADFVNHNNSTPYDDFGHGTFVSSVLAGTGAASGGKYVGVAPNASLVEAKVLNSTGVGHDSDIIYAIDWAIANGSKVISMSFGGTTKSTYPNTPLYQAIDNAVNSGIIVVVAAGNSGPGIMTITYPGDDPNVITVGEVNRSDALLVTSSRGPTRTFAVKPDVVNVGDNVVAARAIGTSFGSPVSQYYTKLTGTSVSTAMTSGVVALILEKNPALTPAQAKNLLEKTAKPLNSTIPNNDSGYGRVEADFAIDNISVVQFESMNYAVNGSFATINVTRVNNSLGPVTVHYGTYDGTAKAGLNYTATNGTLTFNQGEINHTIQVPLNNSPAASNRTFNVMLSNPTGGAVLGIPNRTMVTIMNSTYSYTYHLKKGWNLISIPIVPQDGNLTAFFSPIMGNVSIVWEYNSSNASNPWAYHTTMTDKYEQGTLRSVNERLGYWVRCSNDTNFTIVGPLAESANVTLHSGWNLVGNPIKDIRQPWNAYSTAKIVWEYNSSNASNPWAYHTTMTDKYEQGTLTELRPGFGYWVRL